MRSPFLRRALRLQDHRLQRQGDGGGPGVLGDGRALGREIFDLHRQRRVAGLKDGIAVLRQAVQAFVPVHAVGVFPSDPVRFEDVYKRQISIRRSTSACPPARRILRSWPRR